MRTVLLFGTFDGIHEGHRSLIRQAHAYGNAITIILARDETVKQVKGRAPKYTEEERKEALQKERGIDNVLLGSLGDKYAAIKDLKPDIIALGYDQQAFTDKLEAFVKQHLPSTRIVRLKAHQPEKYKSSLLMKPE